MLSYCKSIGLWPSLGDDSIAMSKFLTVRVYGVDSGIMLHSSGLGPSTFGGKHRTDEGSFSKQIQRD